MFKTFGAHRRTFKLTTEKPVPIVFRSENSKIRGLFYKASGAGSFPTVILCQGFPGGNTDVLGLGERLMKEGFNALAFNYRGTWGSEGLFTVANSLEDVIAAMRYVKSSIVVQEFNVDSSNLVIIGYSYGGSVGLLGSLQDPAARRVVYVGGGDLGEVGRRMQQNTEYRRAIKETIDLGVSDSGFKAPKAEQLIAEIVGGVDRYDLVKHAKILSRKSVFLIGGRRDHANAIEHHVLPLFRALQKNQANVQVEILDTDHSFSNVKGQLAEKIISWLKRNN